MKNNKDQCIQKGTKHCNIINVVRIKYTLKYRQVQIKQQKEIKKNVINTHKMFAAIKVKTYCGKTK